MRNCYTLVIDINMHKLHLPAMFFNHTIGQEEHAIQLVLLQNEEGKISAFQFYFPRRGTKNT